MSFLVTNAENDPPPHTGYMRLATYETIEDAVEAAASMALTLQCDVRIKDNDDNSRVLTITWHD